MKNCLLLILFIQSVFTSIAQEVSSHNSIWDNQVWNAYWISHPDINGTEYGVYHFRKNFDLSEKPEEFIINISADNRYWLYINEKKITTGSAKGDLANYNFDCIDLAPYLIRGKNIIAVTVWNEGTYRSWAQQSIQTALIIQGNTAKEEIINTGAEWLVTKNEAYHPISHDHRVVPARESVFAEKYIWDWNKRTCNTDNWVNAKNLEKGLPKKLSRIGLWSLVPRTIPFPEETPQTFKKIRNNEAMNNSFLIENKPIELHPWQEIKIIFDQEQLTTAYPLLKLSGGSGAQIKITYAESFFSEENHRSEKKPHRDSINGQYLRGIQDIFLLDGGKNRTFSPLYYRTFRYVILEIKNYLEPLIIHEFSSNFTAYPLEMKAFFRSDYPALENIWNVSWRTARLCAYETYMDCPYYEQLQYIGDTRIQALVSLYVSGDDRLMKNSILQFYQSINAEGLTRSRYPDRLEQIIPPFSLFWIGMVHDYWMHRKDDAFVKQFLPAIINVLNWHEKHIDPAKQMLHQVPHWNFVDWAKEWPWVDSLGTGGAPSGVLKGHSSILTLQYANALNEASDILQYYNMKNDAGRLKSLSSKISKASYKECWDKKKMLLADSPDKNIFSQHANILGILSNSIPANDQYPLMLKVLDDKTLIQCTFYYAYYLHLAMKKTGFHHRYVEQLAPWENMLKIGLTTFAEKPEPTRSDCHAWSAHPMIGMLNYLAGIESTAPGFESVLIKPQFGELKEIEVQFPHPKGMIYMKMTKSSEGIKGNIRIPENVKVTFQWLDVVQELVPGNQNINIKASSFF